MDLEVALRTHAAYDLAEDAVEVLRRFTVWPTPLNYELGLHYVADPTGPLARAVNKLVAEGSLHSDDFGDKLAQEFLPRMTLQNEVCEAGDALEREIDEASATLVEAAAGVSTVIAALSTADRDVAAAATLDATRAQLAALGAVMRAAAARASEQERELRASGARVERLRRHLDRARREAMTDPLTTLPNRRAFDREIARACADSDADRTPLFLALIDIDFFKRFNDTWGHQTGDQVIRFVGATLKAFTRPPRASARFGGEEFAVILPREPAESVLRDLNGLRQAVGGRRLRRRQSGEDLGNVTVSIGVAQHEPEEPVSALIERADAALYASKRRGRDRVSCVPSAVAGCAELAA